MKIKKEISKKICHKTKSEIQRLKKLSKSKLM